MAEGVETEALRNLLHRIRCGILQGYLTTGRSRPQPADAFERFARQNTELQPPQLGAGVRTAARHPSLQARICAFAGVAQWQS